MGRLWNQRRSKREYLYKSKLDQRAHFTQVLYSWEEEIDPNQRFFVCVVRRSTDFIHGPDSRVDNIAGLAAKSNPCFVHKGI